MACTFLISGQLSLYQCLVETSTWVRKERSTKQGSGWLMTAVQWSNGKQPPIFLHLKKNNVSCYLWPYDNTFPDPGPFRQAMSWTILRLTSAPPFRKPGESKPRFVLSQWINWSLVRNAASILPYVSTFVYMIVWHFVFLFDAFILLFYNVCCMCMTNAQDSASVKVIFVKSWTA